MNVKRLVKQLEIDEAVRVRVYIDSLGYKTVGIGHMIKDSDPDWLKELEVGHRITDAQVKELFMQDLVEATVDTAKIFADIWSSLPDAAQEVFINMVFNLGATRFMKFKKTIAAVYKWDWDTVATEMLDSKWASQVGNRAGRLSGRIRRLSHGI